MISGRDQWGGWTERGDSVVGDSEGEGWMSPFQSKQWSTLGGTGASPPLAVGRGKQKGVWFPQKTPLESVCECVCGNECESLFKLSFSSSNSF